MRFQVTGAYRITGDEESFVIEAVDQADAIQKANARGLLVSTVTAVVDPPPVVRVRAMRPPTTSWKLWRGSGQAPYPWWKPRIYRGDVVGVLVIIGVLFWISRSPSSTGSATAPQVSKGVPVDQIIENLGDKFDLSSQKKKMDDTEELFGSNAKYQTHLRVDRKGGWVSYAHLAIDTNPYGLRGLQRPDMWGSRDSAKEAERQEVQRAMLHRFLANVDRRPGVPSERWVDGELLRMKVAISAAPKQTVNDGTLLLADCTLLTSYDADTGVFKVGVVPEQRP